MAGPTTSHIRIGPQPPGTAQVVAEDFVVLDPSDPHFAVEPAACRTTCLTHVGTTVPQQCLPAAGYAWVGGGNQRVALLGGDAVASAPMHGAPDSDGSDHGHGRCPAARPAVSFLPRLIAFAQARRAAGLAAADLLRLGLALPDLLHDADAGILPADYADALPTADRAALADVDLGNVLLLPATDAAGAVVDAVGIDLGDGRVRWASLHDAPRGLLLARVAATSPAVHVVATWSDLLRCARAGHRRTLWLRSADEVAAQAPRLHVAGVERATLVGDAAGYAAGLSAAGIAVEVVASIDPEPVVVAAPTTPPAVLRRVSWDRDARRAVFAADDLAVVVDLPATPDAPAEVLLRREQVQHRDRFRLSEPAACDRYARAAARRFACPVVRISAILAALPAALAELAEADDVVVATPSVEDAQAAADAEAALAAGDLVDRFDADQTALGWIGDPQAKLLALLTLAGRVAADPPWLCLRGEPTATLPILGRLAACIPAERHITTPGGVLPLRGDVDLRQGALVVDDARRLRAEEVTALRLLHAHGSVALNGPGRDAAGRMAGSPRSVRGPVAVLAASAAATPLDDLAVVVTLDDSPAQTAAVLAATQAARRQAVDPRHHACIAARWQAILRRLAPAAVVVPCADRIRFPATQPRHRHEHALFLALVDASALLHQWQRLRDGGAVVATEADVAIAIRAAQGVLGITRDGLSPRAAAVLAAIRSAGLTSATTPELAALLPQVPRRSLHHALDELVRFDLLSANEPGRGRSPRRYHLVPTGGSTASVDSNPIRLLTPDEAVLARNGNAAIANISPAVAAG